MKVNAYYKTGYRADYHGVKKAETTNDEVILYIEKHISRYAVNQIEIIEQYAYGEKKHRIEGKELNV